MPGACDDQRITAFGMILEAHAALVGAVSGDLEDEAGMPLTWFEVLVRLSRSPEQRLRMTDLAAQVALSTSGLTRLVDRMEASDLVRREACPSDRRGAFAVLAPAGRRAFERAIPSHLASLQRHLVEPLGAPRLGELTAALEVLRDGACQGEATQTVAG